MKISINTDISVLEFYEYIKNINEYFNSLNKFFGQSILRREFRFELFQWNIMIFSTLGIVIFFKKNLKS